MKHPQYISTPNCLTIVSQGKIQYCSFIAEGHFFYEELVTSSQRCSLWNSISDSPTLGEVTGEKVGSAFQETGNSMKYSDLIKWHREGRLGH